MLKTYQREAKLFEFLRDTNGKELKIRKHNVTLRRLHIVMASLCQGTMSHYNVCLAFEKTGKKEEEKNNLIN